MVGVRWGFLPFFVFLFCAQLPKKRNTDLNKSTMRPQAKAAFEGVTT
jgi:hypothetical protein